MFNGRFYATLNYNYNPLSAINESELNQYVISRLPTLRGKQFNIILYADMRIKKRTDFEAISRRSVQRDFYPERIYLDKKKSPEKRNSVEITTPKASTPIEGKAFRVTNINPSCEYAKYARFFVGRLVRLVRKTGVGDSTTGWYEFLHEKDRAALNQAAGWSDNKKEYLLERPKLK